MKLNFRKGRNMMVIMKKEDRKIYFAGLRAIAKDQRITQSEFASAIGKDQTTISNYMNCKTRPLDEHYDAFEYVVERDRQEIMAAGRQALAGSAATLSASTPSMEMQAQASNIIPYIMDRFQDKPQAESLIAALAEIETHDPHGFSLISGMIHHCHNEIKKRGFEKKGC